MATQISVTRRAPFVSVNLMDIVLFVQMFLLCLFYSQSYNFFEQYRSALFQGIFAIDVLFIFVALPFTPAAALLSALIIGIVLFYQMVFTINYHTAFTGLYVGSYPGLYTAALFAVHARRRSLSRALLILYLACLLYAFVFLYLRHSIDPYTIMKQQIAGGEGVSKAVLRSHGSEVASSGQTSYRIKTSGFHQAFALFYPLAMFRLRRAFLPKLLWGALAVFGIYCLIIADFRFNLACTILAAMVGLLPILSPVAKTASALAIGLMSVAAAVILSVFGVNAFAMFANDETGAFRASEFIAALPELQRFPFFGIGLPGQGDDYQVAFSGKTVYPSDLGYFGELLQHGALGVILLIWCHFLIYLLIVRLYRRTPAGVDARILLDCFVYTVLTDLVITNLWEGASCLLIAFAIAYSNTSGSPAQTVESGRDPDEGLGRAIEPPTRAAS